MTTCSRLGSLVGSVILLTTAPVAGVMGTCFSYSLKAEKAHYLDTNTWWTRDNSATKRSSSHLRSEVTNMNDPVWCQTSCLVWILGLVDTVKNQICIFFFLQVFRLQHVAQEGTAVHPWPNCHIWACAMSKTFTTYNRHVNTAENEKHLSNWCWSITLDNLYFSQVLFTLNTCIFCQV